jgi:hypothetical protein
MSQKDKHRNIPVVFISSTVEDLKAYRVAADFEAQRAGFKVQMLEYWVASADKPPVKKCLEEVAKADVLVAIVAHRYGWVPPDQTGGDAKSITWLECEEARRDGAGKKKMEVLAFLVAQDSGDFKWPLELREEYRLAEAAAQSKFTPELGVEVQRNLAKLQEFKKWLGAPGIYHTFTSPDSLRAEVAASLRGWLTRHPEFAESLEPRGRNDPRAYLRALQEQTAWIDIRGLHARTGKALQPFPIEDLYIPLTTATSPAEERGQPAPGRGKPERLLETPNREPLELVDVLALRRLVIVGDPGSGKSTFLKRVAFELSRAWLDEEAGLAAPLPAGGAGPQGEIKPRRTFRESLAAALQRTFARKESEAAETGGDRPRWPFPILIRVADLVEHIRVSQKRSEGPATSESAEWLVHFLTTQSKELNWQIDEAFFRRQLDGGLAMLLIDGLDEAPAGLEQQGMARLFEKATLAYQRCPFVVTTRPLAYEGEATLAGFELARIEPLNEPAIEQFLLHWCGALYAEAPSEQERHQRELREALHGSGDTPHGLESRDAHGLGRSSLERGSSARTTRRAV